MQPYHPGDIVLLAFPFSNTADTKRRPALVLLDTGDADIIVARITSHSARTTFDIEVVKWKQAGLLLPSVARIHKLATLEKRLIHRKLGTLAADDWAQIHATVHRLWCTS